jgi:hypothetical protein
MKAHTKLLMFTLGILLLASACSLPGNFALSGDDALLTQEAPIIATEEATTTSAPTPAAQQDYWQYWRVIEIPDYGVSIAIPCFWLTPSPEEVETFGGNFSIRNYTDEYAMSFPRSNPDDIWAAGGRKIDIGIFRKDIWEVENTATLEALTAAMFRDESDNQLTSTQVVQINGADALEVMTQSTFGVGLFYLFDLGEGNVLLFGARFEDFRNDPDVQAILSSVTTPGREVYVPNSLPMAPPVGLTADCLPAVTEDNQP